MNLEDLISSTINNNTLVKVNEKIYLTKYQIEVLDRFHIEYNYCSDIKEIIFLIEDILDTDYDEELDELAKNLQEFSYYNFTNK